MYMYTQGHSRLISTGAYIPAQRVTSREIMEQIDSVNRFDIRYDWLERTTGIYERRVAPDDIKPSDMAAKAALEAMERGGVKPTEIDAIIYSGVIRDYLEPATAHIVQHKLGASNAIAFDVSNACLGFMSAMHLMDSLIATGQARRGLVVTGEKGYDYSQKACGLLSKTQDRQIFHNLIAGLTIGDAGAAVIMGPKLAPDTGFMGFIAQSDGQFNNLCFAGGNKDGGPLVTNILEIVRETTKLVGPMYHELMEKHLKWRPAELNRYIPHQVGLKSVKKHAEVANVSLNIVPITINFLGNIVSATIPVNLHLLSAKNQLALGEKIYLSGTGSGICLAQAGLVWDAA